LRRWLERREPPGGRLTDHISLGVLSAAFSRDLIEEVIGAAGKCIGLVL
jgi:hypothetical protein